MAITKYQYTISTEMGGESDVPLLEVTIAADAAITTDVDHIDANVEADKCDIYMADALDAPQETALDAVIAGHELASVKYSKVGEIDTRTDELIAEGFEYPAASGKMFELTLGAQNRLESLDRLRSDPAITYPIRWNTMTDDDYHDVVDAADMHTMAMTALATYRAVIDSGTDLKNQVRAAPDVATVNAIVDPR
jgi:hypothetical protein